MLMNLSYKDVATTQIIIEVKGLHIIDGSRAQHSGQGLEGVRPLLSAPQWLQRHKQTE
jgi:hypothetical protein